MTILPPEPRWNKEKLSSHSAGCSQLFYCRLYQPRTIEHPCHIKEHQRILSVSFLFVVNVLLSMSYHRVLPPLPVVPLSGHSPDLASQYFPFLRPRVMTDQATTQASKSNTVKQSSPILENLVLRRETTPPTTDSLEDEESPKRARSSSPTFISRDNSQQLQKKPSMPSESKESPASLQGESPTSEVCLCQPDPKVPRPRNGMLSLNFLAELDFVVVSQLSRMNKKNVLNL